MKLVLATNDIEYIKKCVINRRRLRLAPFHYVKLIIGTNDVQYMKMCINNRRKLKLCSHYVSQLILATNDKKYITDCINNGVKKGLDSYIITQLIFNTNNIVYYKKCIHNWKRLGLKGSDISFLIKSINDVEYTKECINRYIKILNSDDITYLIVNTADNKFKVDCVKNSKKYNLNSNNLLTILLTSNDLCFINNNVNIAINSGLTKRDLEYLYKTINNDFKGITKLSTKYISKFIPKNMTCGIEIETVGFYMDKLNKIIVNSHIWNITKDDTVQENISGQYGREIISPVLKLDNNDELYEVNYVLKLFQNINQSVNDSCGGHIHIGFDYMKSTSSLLNLIELWANMEYIFIVTSNKIGTIPRGVEYAAPISRDIERVLNQKSDDIIDMDFSELKLLIKSIQGTKGKTINFLNIDSKNKNTIEFRSPNGTLNYNIWIQNIVLFANLIYVCQYISDVKNNQISITKNERTKILNIYNNLISSKDNLEKLKLFLDNDMKKIYIERFNTNDILMRKNKDLYRLIKSKVSKNRVFINKLTK